MSSSKSQVKDKGITKSTSRPLPQSVFDEVDATIVKTFETRGAKGDPILIAAARNIKSRFIKPEHFDLVQKLLTEDKDFARRYFFHVDFFPQIIDRYQQMSRTKQIREPITDNNVMGRFTPVLGAHNPGPLCYLLELPLDTPDQEKRMLRILLDCGWDERFDVATLEALHHIGMDTIDVVLISHADLAHMGGLLYAIATFPDFTAKIIVTEAVAQLAEVFLFDCLHARKTDSSVDPDLLEELEEAYDELVLRMHADKKQYSQPINLALDQISATAYAAGHTLGSAIWRINTEYESVVYAVDFNHTPEGILEKLDVAKIQRPSVLITDCNFRHISSNKNATVKASDRQIERLLHETFTLHGGGGNVLLPCSSARALELLFRLQQIWSTRQWAGSYGILFCQFSAEEIFERMGIMTEWMSKEYSKTLDGKELFKVSSSDNKVWTSSSDFKYVMSTETLEQSLDEAQKAGRPLAVIASNAFLECGLAKAAFMKLRISRRNLVLLTEDTLPGTLLASLKVQLGGGHAGRFMQRKFESMLQVSTFTEVPLEGNALRHWKAKQAAKVATPRTPRTPRVGTPRVGTPGVSEGGEEGDAEADEEDGYEDEDDLLALGDRVFPMFEFRKPAIPYATAYGHRVVEGQNIAQLMNASSKPITAGTAIVYPRMTLDDDDDDDDAASETADDNADPTSPKLSGRKRRAEEISADTPTTPGVATPFVPTRLKITRRVVRVECRLAEVYRPGRSNLQDKIHTIQHVQPTSLVLVHGRTACTKALVSSLRKRAVFRDASKHRFFSPRVNQPLMLRSTHKGFKIMMSDALWQSLPTVPIGSFTLAPVRGTFRKGSTKNSMPVLLKISEGSGTDVPETPDSQMISRKRVTLSRILHELKQHNIAAKFVRQNKHGFTQTKIYCENSKVEVLERETDRLNSGQRSRSFTIRGKISVEYFEVRRLIYSMHVIV